MITLCRPPHKNGQFKKTSQFFITLSSFLYNDCEICNCKTGTKQTKNETAPINFVAACYIVLLFLFILLSTIRLIVSLFLVGVLLLVFIYCKQQAKQARLEGMGEWFSPHLWSTLMRMIYGGL